MTVLVDEQRSDLWSEVSRESVSGWSSCELDYDLSRWEPEELAGLLTGHREINEEAQKNQLLWIEVMEK
ncbi:hypothetical protein PPACK8108_LOCUS3817 [Phakopsora pachyrhizi]|uniref:Uncharacterized protein n=1 Tax=Phakopsora pachyrhizi TaxID=170000 RepID=A0AAV0ANU7_PHAPC|nr:hypothetical protein PPACK8108_LOCUS3817 [Phakopsora pachyrhizi]